MAKVKDFRNVGQMPRLRSQGHLRVIWRKFSLTEYRCSIWSLYLFQLKRYDQGQSFHKWMSMVTVKVTRSKVLAWSEMKYENSTSHRSKVLAKVIFFRNVGQRSRLRSQGHRPVCHLEGIYQQTCTCQTLRFYLLRVKLYGQGWRVFFCHILTDRQTHRQTDTH